MIAETILLLFGHLFLSIVGANAIPQNPLYGYPTHPNSIPYPNTSYSPTYSSSYVTMIYPTTSYPTTTMMSIYTTPIYTSSPISPSSPVYPTPPIYPTQPGYPSSESYSSSSLYESSPTYPTYPMYSSSQTYHTGYTSQATYPPTYYPSPTYPPTYMSSYTAPVYSSPSVYYPTTPMTYPTEYTSPSSPPSYPTESLLSSPYAYPSMSSLPGMTYPMGYTPPSYPSQSMYSPSYSPSQGYPSQPYPPYTSSSPAYPSISSCPTSGLDINHPNVFELWTYAPGTCDLDNKPVSSSINYPFNIAGPSEYYFIENSVTPPMSYANKGDLWTLTCNASAMAAQAYLRPTHGTPFYFLLFGDPNSDPTPQLTLHDNFTLVAGTGAEVGKVFLSYGSEGWLACPGDQNSYTGKTQYSVYWNPDPLSNCVSFRIEVRQGQRQCTC